MKEYKVTVDEDGTVRWHKPGTNELHREDGPAVEYADGDKYWYINGKRHREDGSAIEYPDGTKYWYITGECDRENGKAIEWADGDKEWYINGERHREDGPAIERADGDKYWYINGKYLTEQQFNARTSSCAVDGKVVEIDGKQYKLQEVKQ